MNNYDDLDNPGNVSSRPQAMPEGSHFAMPDNAQDQRRASLDETVMADYSGENSPAAGFDEAPAPEAQQPAPRPQRYTRARTPHKTVAPINDFDNQASSDGFEGFTHDSDYANRGSVLSGRSYRKSRSEMPQLRRDLHYGQYLEIPKGRRDIFASRERKMRIRSVIALIAVIVILAVIVFFVWQYMQVNWGATG